MKTLLLLSALIAILGFATYDSGELSDKSKDKESPKTILCSWLNHGETYNICSSDGLEKAQEACDKAASKMRETPSRCTCTDDPKYIQGACD